MIVSAFLNRQDNRYTDIIFLYFWWTFWIRRRNAFESL